MKNLQRIALLHVVEIHHERAPAEVRALVALHGEQVNKTLSQLGKLFDELLILSTCNRTAFYFVGGNPLSILQWMAEHGGKPVMKLIEQMTGAEPVARQLIYTACGLRSQIVGEYEILHQIKRATARAKQENTLGPFLHRLVETALRAGKQVRTETGLSDEPASYPSVVRELIEKNAGKDAHITVVGDGNLARTIAQYLTKHFNTKLLTEHQAHNEPISCDVLISLAHTRLKLTPSALKSCKMIIDFAIPPSIQTPLTIPIYTIDNLNHLTLQALARRRKHIPEAIPIAEQHVKNYLKWFRERLTLCPEIKNAREKIHRAEQQLKTHLHNILSPLPPHTKRSIEKAVSYAFRKSLHEYYSFLRHNQNSLHPHSTIHINKTGTIRVGSRYSLLARIQAQEVINKLAHLAPYLSFEVVPVETSGDQQQWLTPGAFVKELEQALLNGKVDIAVHSLKDMPLRLEPGCILAAVLPRNYCEDALLVREGLTPQIEELPPAAVVGTSSVRRQTQLLYLRPDLRVRPLRGNIDTRLKKLLANEYDAILISTAGLTRLHLLDNPPCPMSILPPEKFVPAPGQGVIAVECLQNYHELKFLLNALNHLPTLLAVTIERTLLKEMGGGCHLPLGAFCRLQSYHTAQLIIFLGNERQPASSIKMSTTIPINRWQTALKNIVSTLKSKIAYTT